MLKSSAVVSVKWLASRMASKDPCIRILDGSFHMPAANRDPKAEYTAKHIPGALFFDINECANQNSPYPHMLPSPEEFEDYVRRMGIKNNSHVIVYDTSEKFGLFSAARVWWTFRVFGHDSVSVLDGGLPKWLSLNQSVTDKVGTFTPSTFIAKYRPELVKNFNDINDNIENKFSQVVDARPEGRFQGTAPEPRADIKSGHFQGATNIPFTRILNSETKTILKKEDLLKTFENVNIDLNKPIIASCGSGVSACCIALAAYLCDYENVSVYDGSWTEWAQRISADKILSKN
ncbi:3-mercaptopyruvate sulfurtransferase [Octopus bimaculoides]|uniref:Sulfurtransferase n=1 Tax=Octopus bimaculoides TaxID=37653 RepID=A0A0L8G982_OCTBM|nr:3-mercaptopyruvate sulfurtransferase [Octopus bimaculoides]|eukprot:XP_014783097.1 PREDICTED: 3-mercaptopyruvate sulfurtransferase-like [Octopus bimaculoides]